MSAVTEFLTEHRIDYSILDHRRAFTAREEARTLHLNPADVAKTVAVVTSDGFALAVLPASSRLDMTLVAAATGDRHARLATEREIELRFPGFDLGALPPLGDMLGVPMYIDPDLTEHDDVVFAAGSRTESVRMRLSDLLEEASVTIAPLTRRGAEPGIF